MARPSIAVVIPTHNRPDDLERALSSLSAQTQPPDEVFVVDDGSVPPVDLGSGILAFPFPLQVLRNPQPLGAPASRNRGVQAAASEWIAFLDDDDAFVPQKVEALRECLAAHPDSDVVYHGAQIVMADEGLSYHSQPYPLRGLANDGETFRLFLKRNLIGGTSMVAVRREALLGVGGFNLQVPAQQDYELWLRLAAAGCRFWFLDQSLTVYYHRTGQGSLSKSLEKHLAGQKIIRECHQEHYAQFSEKDWKEYDLQLDHYLVHKALLGGSWKQAVILQARSFRKHPGAGSLARLGVLLCGPRLVFLLRSSKKVRRSTS